MASEQIENYLKHIYKLQEDAGRVTTTSLSERLNISAASVTGMVKKLAEEKLIEHTPYRGVALTPAGRKEALRIVRRHRLWELFLAEVLKFDWEEIDAEAEKLEHIMSQRLEDRIDEILGYPTRDPHGDAIPSPEGKVDRPGHPPLTQVPAGSRVTVSRVSDANPDVLRYARQVGIRLGTRITVRERIAFDGSLRAEVGGTERFISEKLAGSVFVEPEKRRKA